MTTAQKLRAFNNAKRRGDITTLVERTGFSQPMITLTLQGRRNNEFIVESAYRLVRRRKAAQIA